MEESGLSIVRRWAVSIQVRTAWCRNWITQFPVACGVRQLIGMATFILERGWTRDRTVHRAIRCATLRLIRRPELPRWRRQARRFFLFQGQRLPCLQTEQTPESSGHLTINHGRNPALIMPARLFTRMMQQILPTNCGTALRLRATGIVPEEQLNLPFRPSLMERCM